MSLCHSESLFSQRNSKLSLNLTDLSLTLVLPLLGSALSSGDRALSELT